MKAEKIRNKRGSWKGFRIGGLPYAKGTITQRDHRSQLTTTLTREIREDCPMTGATMLAWRRVADGRWEVVVVQPGDIVEKENAQ